MKDRQNELLALAEKAIAFGSKQVDQLEILVQDQFEVSSEVILGEISKAIKTQEAGASIRCVRNKQIGSAFTNRLDYEALKHAIKQSIAAAKASSRDDTWKDFPVKATYGKSPDVWDDSIPEKSPSDFVNLTVKMTKKAMSHDPDIIVGQAGIGGIYGWNAYANSNGVNVADRGTVTYAFVGLVAKTQNGMTPMVVEVDVKRRYQLETEKIVDNAVRDVMLAKKPAKGETTTSPIIMSAPALGELLYYTLIPALRGENVVRGKSVLAKRQGELVAEKTLTIIDDGLKPGAYNTSLFDGEGVPRQTTPIIKNGELCSFFWDTYWAYRQGVHSTGNASRSLRTGVVSIQPSNLIIPPGKQSLEDLLSNITTGYLIKGFQGAHSSNQDTGDFSVVANPAFRIERGQLTGACHGLMLGGNIFELLQKVDQLASDARNNLIWGMGDFVAPSILFADVQVAAKD